MARMIQKLKPDMLNRVGTMVKPFVYLRIITLSIICLIVFVVLIYFSFFFRKNYIIGKAQVLKHECKASFDNKGNTRTNCIYNIKFKASDGKTYTTSLTSGVQKETNDMIYITYDPIHPQESVSTVFNKWIIIGICGFILLMLIISLVFNIIYRNNTLVGAIDAYRSI